MSRLIINNIQIELEPSKPISRTLQVNDIATLNNRQTNFTPTFSIPRTANNIRAFEKLGIIGNNSGIPYQRNNAYYYSESGECLIYNGWAIITSINNDFKCNLYDGNIDLYKAIENTTIASLPLDEINHIKTLDNVVDSINGLTTYKYILADYNGKALYDTNKINIDYLVPSVPVSYIWNKIFDFYGFTYSGSVFDTFAFQNLYMTFPKGISEADIDQEVFYESEAMTFEQNESVIVSVNPTLEFKRSSYLYNITAAENNLEQLTSNRHFKVGVDGVYRLRLNFHAYCEELSEPTGFSDAFYDTRLRRYDIWLAKNADGIINSDNVTLVEKLASNVLTDAVSIDRYFNLNSDESFCIVLRTVNSTHSCHRIIYVEGGAPYMKLEKIENIVIDFTGAFIDFKTKDFLNEVLTRFGLTPYKEKYSNNYKFLTLYELLQDNDVVDWSASKNKFIEKTNEKYIYGSYAQKNDFVYKYNDKEGDYNNGSLLIENINLQDNRTVINSAIYSPEKIKTNILFKETNVYKLWNKEVKDDSTVTYKSLDKRFYFLRADNFIFDSEVVIGSETYATETTISQAPYESFFKLGFNDIIQDFYLPIYQVLNKAKILDANVFLKEQDIVNIDFSKLYWIEELGNYFILNKINNFRGNGATKCELIKVDYIPPINLIVDFPVIITDYNDGCLTFESIFPNVLAKVYVSTNAGETFNFVNAIVSSTFVVCGYSFGSGDLIRFDNPSTNEQISNIFEIP